jgi:hypothetical protein
LTFVVIEMVALLLIRNVLHRKSALFDYDPMHPLNIRAATAIWLEHTEGLVRNLRAELAKAHFAISSSNSVPSAA